LAAGRSTWRGCASFAVGDRAALATAVSHLPPRCTAGPRPPPPGTAVGGSLGAAALALAALLWKGRGDGLAVTECDALSHELSAEEQRTVDLFQKCSASVVHINTFSQQEALVRGTRGYHVDLQEIPQGTGSGFVWDAEHIVTNFHVIKDADRATVVLSDHTSCEASLVGVEPDCDLAVLRVEGRRGGGCREPLVPLERGGSSHLQVGQRVLAIGNRPGSDAYEWHC